MAGKIIVKQVNIFGDIHEDVSKSSGSDSYKNVTSTRKTNLPDFNISSCVDFDEASKNSILIHRILQRNCVQNNRNKDMCYVFLNELYVKRGNIDAGSSARDSMIKFYVCK